MKNLLIILISLMSVAITAQTYTDKSYIQDYADKFELTEKLKNVELLQVQVDRNNFINVLSSQGLLQPVEKQMVENMLYRPLVDMNLLLLKKYDDQFVYLTDKAVLSNSWAGKFYIEHGLKDPTQFVVAHEFTTLVAGVGELVLFQDAKKVWAKSLDDFEPIDMIFDKNGKRFLILTENAVYQLKCPEKELLKVKRAV